MIFNSIIQHKMTRITLMNQAIIETWATKTVWYWREAINLSIGCSPENTCDVIVLSSEEAMDWGKRLRNRVDESERAMITGELPYIKIKYCLDDEKTFPAFRPLDFVSWLRQSKLPHSLGLYDAVYMHHSRELDEASQQARYVFRKKLQAWEVRFGDTLLEGIKDLLGMTYIKLLLQSVDNQPLDVFEIQGLAGGHSRIDGTDECDSDAGTEDESVQYQENLSEYSEASDSVIDDTARRQYRENLEELKERLEIANDSSNSAAAAEIRLEMEFIEGELRGATGLGGRIRRLNPSSEKFRKSITKAIREAISNIRMLEGTTAIIADHLSNRIHTGTTSYYDSKHNDPPIEWHF